MPPTNNEQLQELLQLTRDNNRMLHAMRRNAFIGGTIKLALYAAMLILPFIIYTMYLAPIVADMQRVMNQVQGTGTQAQAQMQGLQDALKGLQQYIPVLQDSQ